MDNMSLNVPEPTLKEKAECLLNQRILGSISDFADAHLYASEVTTDEFFVAVGMIVDLLRAPDTAIHMVPASWPASLAWPPTLSGYLYTQSSVQWLRDLVNDIGSGRNLPASPIERMRDRLLAFIALQLDGRYPSTFYVQSWQDRDGHYEYMPFGLHPDCRGNVTFKGERWFRRMIEDRPWLASLAASAEKPDMIRFYASNTDAQRGRWSEMRVGRFLTRYKQRPCGEVILTEDAIREIAEKQHKAMSTDYSDPTKWVLMMGTTRDDFRHVYTHGPHSCMSHDFGNLRCHPTEVYASGDFAIAWLRSVDDPDMVIARCVVAKEKRRGVLPRAPIYPNPNNWRDDQGRLYLSAIQATAAADELEARLDALGYGEDSGRDFRGAHLLRIGAGGDAFIAPYLDNGYGVADDGCYLVMGRSDEDCPSPGTGGTVEFREVQLCDRCSDDCYGDTHEVVTEVNRDGTRSRYTQTWCEHCMNNYTFFCEELGDTVDEDLGCVEIIRRRDRLDPRRGVRRFDVNDAYAEAHTFGCERTNQRYHTDDFTAVDVDGETWCLEDSINFLFWCRFNEAFYGISDEHSGHEGFHADTTFRDRAIARQRELVTHGLPHPLSLAA